RSHSGKAVKLKKGEAALDLFVPCVINSFPVVMGLVLELGVLD
uniref:Uncharacterized protein n=1 Tax=Aegilops tauschii subsp. strangulata TaxID=200361 RepID=A0A453S159_AEGTS